MAWVISGKLKWAQLIGDVYANKEDASRKAGQILGREVFVEMPDGERVTVGTVYYVQWKEV